MSLLFSMMFKTSLEILFVSETHRRPTCLIGVPLETSTCFIGNLDKLYWRPICNRHAPSETVMPDRQPIGNQNAWFKTAVYSDLYVFKFRLDSIGMLVSNGSPQPCRFLMGNVGFRWRMMSVSIGAYRSPMGHVGLRWVGLRSPMGLWSGVMVSDGSPIGLW